MQTRFTLQIEGRCMPVFKCTSNVRVICQLIYTSYTSFYIVRRYILKYSVNKGGTSDQMQSCTPQLHCVRLEGHTCHSLSEKGNICVMSQVKYTTYIPLYIGLGRGGEEMTFIRLIQWHICHILSAIHQIYIFLDWGKMPARH